jgi:predicted helicase
MSNFKLKPTHAPVKAYYQTLGKLGQGNFDNEGNIRRAFESLLEKCARSFEWFVVAEYQITRPGKSPLRVDAAVLDAFNLPRGYWEAKDEKDDLTAEMNKKFAAGYPRTNILFQAPTRAILVQDGRIVFDGGITDPEKLVEVLRLFFEWRQPHQEDWDRAVREFSERIPLIASGAMTLIAGERKSNPAFVERFTAFAELCRESINPGLNDEAVEEMLVQHLLTERIFRRIFDNPEFTRRNVIAAEIEKVIDSLTKRHFSRDSFLKDLDPFYKAIEETAATASSYAEKQAFLNKVYERFFQGFNKKQADTHGIVYTPQPIVDFMVRSVEEVLKAEFGRSLSDKGVHILDPFVGTGNFITRVMKEIKTSSLPHKYKEELHCNEIMLLPYYIASMNIEHAYLDRVGEYEPFEGICLVDTFELSDSAQGSLFTTENTARVIRQKSSPITVVIGNPPYNTGQANEDDQNKNRKYEHWDKRVSETYARDSTATLKSKLSDPYVKAFRWASDRIGKHGIVALVTNNGFLDKKSFDGMRKHLASDFTSILHLNLKGDAHTSGERRAREAGNIFDNAIRVGVGITLLVRNPNAVRHQIKLYSVDDYLRSWEKRDLLLRFGSFSNTPLAEIIPDSQYLWLTEGQQEGFSGLIALGDKETKGEESTESIFRLFSLGVATNRDEWVYSYDPGSLRRNFERNRAAFSQERARYLGLTREERESYVPSVRSSEIKWTDRLANAIAVGTEIVFGEEKVRACLYRPFDARLMYFDSLLNQRRYQQHHIFPTADSLNQCICLNVSPGNSAQYCLAGSRIPDLHFTGDTQCFPFYTYDEDGSNRRENITDWALGEFRSHYGDSSISKWDIFHYTYGLLHHPEYRTRYAANLKRELPRIPLAPEFHRYAQIGAALMKLHIDYEQQAEYPLERTETGQLNWRVEKMALSKDKTQLKYNKFLTLSGIPPEAYDYRLGNRSALEWVVDQYRVSTDARSGIVNDPNREDDPEYIVRLVGQVVTVSLETVRLVKELARLGIDQA